MPTLLHHGLRAWVGPGLRGLLHLERHAKVVAEFKRVRSDLRPRGQSRRGAVVVGYILNGLVPGLAEELRHVDRALAERNLLMTDDPEPWRFS